MIKADQLKQAAYGKWRGIFKTFGIDVPDSPKVHGPCPICGPGNNSHRFRCDDKNGNGEWICTQCGAGDGIGLVQKILGIGFPETLERINEIVGTVEFKPVEQKNDDERIKKYMQALWKRSKPISGGDIGAKYLRSRGIMILPDPSQVRVCMDCDEPETKTKMVAIIALVMSNETNRCTGIHRTFLSSDGLSKADIKDPRKSLGTVGGGAVRLSNGIGDSIGIAEGIETALAAQQLTGIPCWSVIDANGMDSFIPPTEEGFNFSKVFIFGDNDSHYRGQKAAYSLAHKLYKKPYEKIVKVEIPDFQGMDWNDVLLKSK
jgi:putative DNA primase/helicase